MTTQEMIDVLKAYQEGKEIQVLLSGKWVEVLQPHWNFYANVYRIKPEEKYYYYRVIKNTSSNNIGERIKTSHCINDSCLKEITKEQYENNKISYEDDWLLGMKVKSITKETKDIITSLSKDFVYIQSYPYSYNEFFKYFKFI